MDNRVFVNRILNMKKIRYIGLDMDHTLIQYHTDQFEKLVHQLVIERLIDYYKYPTDLRDFPFHFNDAIRGLVIDSKKGNILKLSRFGAIRQSVHGTKPIDYAEQKKMYRSTYVDLKDHNYMAIDTAFSIAFCVLLGQLIEYKDEHPTILPDYATIAHDVLQSVDEVHADGSLKGIIAEQLDTYVKKSEAVVQGLLRYKAYGKKLFILTNSDFFYSKLLLEYAINPFLPPGEDWTSLFEYVITLAGKPRFFYDHAPFLRINPETGAMLNAKNLSPGVYQGGCAKTFTDQLQSQGDEILYIGDHIYGDIVRLKKDCNWRTALVVEELNEEIIAQQHAKPIEAQLSDLMAQKEALESRYLSEATQSIEQHQPLTQSSRELQHDITILDTEIGHLLQQQKQFYNPTWGRVFRAGAEESYFAHQVDRFACIYMGQLSDLLAHSPITYFRAHRRLLPHDTV